MRSVSKGQLVLGALREHHTALTPSPAGAFWGPPVQGALKLTSWSSLLNRIDRSLVGVSSPGKVLAASVIVLHLSQKLMGNHSIKRSAVEYTKSQYEFRRMRAAHQRHAKAQLYEMIFFFFISTDFLGEIR